MDSIERDISSLSPAYQDRKLKLAELRDSLEKAQEKVEQQVEALDEEKRQKDQQVEQRTAFLADLRVCVLSAI